MPNQSWKHLTLVSAAVGIAVGISVGVSACGESRRTGDAARAEAGGAQRPNVLLVVFDTTRADRCSVNGYERPTTPTLEALADEGVVYRDCWSPSPWTAPAHASLFTGRLPRHLGLIGSGARPDLAADHTTLAERLRGAGYETACYSANEFVSPHFGLHQGFGRFWASWKEGEIPSMVATRAHTLAAEFALEQHRLGQPFFVFVNDFEPHAPYDPPEAYRRQFLPPAEPAEVADAVAFAWPRTIGYTMGVLDETPRTMQLVSSLYDAEIASLDAALAPLIETFREAGLLDDTIVIVAGDHGENLGERHQAEHSFSCNRTLLHVPLVIRYPAAFEPGTVVDDVVRLEDLFPTVLELCGLDVPEEIDGESLLRDLPGRIARADYGVQDGPIAAAQQRFPFVDVAPFRVSMRSVYDGSRHLIERSDGRLELYDVSADPLELQNLAGRNVDDVRRLRALLEK